MASASGADRENALLWKFRTGFGCDDIAIAIGRDLIHGSAAGAAVRVFSLKGQSGLLWPPPPPATVAGPTGALQTG
jgi:hypothetical protein